MRRQIETPRLVHVSEECLDSLFELLTENSFDMERVEVCSGGEQSSAIARRIADDLRLAGSQVVERRDLTGRLEQVEALADAIAESQPATLLAVGGGRVIDSVKLAAARSGVPFVSVPTAISHDGVSSPVASLFAHEGRRQSYAATMPSGIVIDVAVIGAAPPRLLRAGLGDLVSNLTAILDWRLAEQAVGESYDAYSAEIAESAARSVLRLDDLEAQASHERLAKGLLMSGLAMAHAGTSRPCSGAEHLISHALDHALGPRVAMHGEQVALGTLISAAAHGSPLLEDLHEVYGRLGMPRRPSDVGLDPDDVRRAVQDAPATRPSRYTVLSERDLSDAAVERLLDAAFA
jgi:glycerol-1-phosphate dehydrogenase [NAD(P)+]